MHLGVRRIDGHVEESVPGGRQSLVELAGDCRVGHHNQLDRRAATPDKARQVFVGDEVQIFAGAERRRGTGRRRHHESPAGSAAPSNEIPQYRCCCPLRATVVSTPAVFVPVLAAHRSVRPAPRDVLVTPDWSSR